MTGLVSQQGEMLQSIDMNMDQSVDNMQRAQDNLAKFMDGISGNRPLVIKTFLVLILFALFFFVFLK